MNTDPRPIRPIRRGRLAGPEALAARPDVEIDVSALVESFRASDWHCGFKRPRQFRGIAVGIDADLFDWFRTHTPAGEDFTVRINAALREYVAKAGE